MELGGEGGGCHLMDRGDRAIGRLFSDCAVTNVLQILEEGGLRDLAASSLQ